jgi:hypothetical protein
MESVWVPIVVAIIMGPIVVILQLLRRENTDQHAEGRTLLRLIGDKVDEVGSKIDAHIGWHEGIEDSVEKED